ncbi:hypothetical protein OHS33_25135 [Streptomyces sp. NBC_00536]|nr:hypothetical protein [Streptomyces sp. NBC_00536]WUC81330.1 hypothetical protein OHS33_25135 [Streptomyces sp. NBC_00536]
MKYAFEFTSAARRQLRDIDQSTALRILVIEVGHRREIYRRL